MADRPLLRALADRLGILPGYTDTGGTERHTSDATRVALLAAMGFDASDEAAAARALESLDEREEECLLPPVRVVRGGGRGVLRARLRVAEEGSLSWWIELREEWGGRCEAEGRSRVRRGQGAVEIPLPAKPGPGYHVLRVRARTSAGEREGEQSFIVAPPTCPTPRDRLGARRLFGLTSNLYAVRSGRNWGVGDLTDLRELLRWGREIGAAFVGVNPLHALRNRGQDISPYRPVSRLFRNVLYLDVTAVPELPDCPQARDQMASGQSQTVLARLRASAHVEYERVLALKGPVLQALYRTFIERHRGPGTDRGRAYAQYLEREGEALAHFATFLALEAHFSRKDPRLQDWRAWPPAYRDPRSKEVQTFRESHAEEVDFHCYLQFELDRQLAWASEEARALGLPIGVYQDLALGTAPGGSDPWAFPGLFLDGATLGAPPDAYSKTGQDWALPPVDPRRLTADRYRYWVRLLRAALAHSGALRIDHVMGLFRLFWIPAGRPPTEGAYVRYPSEDLLGILALESTRTGALVIGEDLGTVPKGLPRKLARWGILSSRVLYFQRGQRGGFLPSSRYPRRALVTANTHDLPTLAGFWWGRDLTLRREAGHIKSEEELREAQIRREGDRRELHRRLASEGLLPAREAPPSDAELSAAVHAFLCRTPARLVGISLDDLIGEVEPVNLPGVEIDRYRSWTRRLRLPLEEIPADPAVHRALSGTQGRTWARASAPARPRA